MAGQLTEEQKNFLAECEAEFSNRYTESDKDFMKVKDAGISQPPIVQSWYPKQRGVGGGNRGRHDFRGHRGRDRHRNDFRDRAEHRGYRDDFRNRSDQRGHRDDFRDREERDRRHGDDSRDRGNRNREFYEDQRSRGYQGQSESGAGEWN